MSDSGVGVVGMSLFPVPRALCPLQTLVNGIPVAVSDIDIVINPETGDVASWDTCKTTRCLGTWTRPFYQPLRISPP